MIYTTALEMLDEQNLAKATCIDESRGEAADNGYKNEFQPDPSCTRDIDQRWYRLLMQIQTIK